MIVLGKDCMKNTLNTVRMTGDVTLEVNCQRKQGRKLLQTTTYHIF